MRGHAKLPKSSIADGLIFIHHAQAAGFGLDQIRQVLAIVDSGNTSCQHVSHLIDGRLAEVDGRTAELEANRTHLRILTRRAAAQDPADCRGYCSIIRPTPRR